MARLLVCTFCAIVITPFAMSAQDGQGAGGTDVGAGSFTAELVATGRIFDADGVVLLGRDKASVLCPEFCAPRRVTSPEQASVGEREVLTYIMMTATDGSKMRVDSRRQTLALLDKMPSAAVSEAPTMVTRDTFRPALDPVLAEPPTEQTE